MQAGVPCRHHYHTLLMQFIIPIVLYSNDLSYSRLVRVLLVLPLICAFWYANGMQYVAQHLSILTSTQTHQIHATKHTSSERLQQLIPAGSVWAMDLTELAQRVRKSSVWVKEVRLRRRFPNVLVMKVVEYEFAGMYQDPAEKKKYCLITSAGEVVRIGAKRVKNSGLEGLCSVGGSRFLVADFLHVWKLLNKHGLYPKVLRYTPYGGWNVVTRDSVLLKLNPKNPETSIKAFLKCDEVGSGYVVDARYVPRVTYTPEADTHFDQAVHYSDVKLLGDKK